MGVGVGVWVRLPEALQVADEAGRDAGDEAALGHDAGLDVVELQAGVVARHLPWGGEGGGGEGLNRETQHRGRREHVSHTNAVGEAQLIDLYIMLKLIVGILLQICANSALSWRKLEECSIN